MKPYKSSKWPFMSNRRQRRFMVPGIGPPGPDMRLYRHHMRSRPGRGPPGLDMRLYRYHMRSRPVRGPPEPDTRPHRCLIILQQDMGPLEPDMGLPGSDMGTPGPGLGPCRIHMGTGPNIGPPGPDMGPPGPGVGPCRIHMGPGPSIGPPGPDMGAPEPEVGPCRIHMGPGQNIGPPGPGPSMCPLGQNMGIPGMSESGIGYPGIPPLPSQVMPQPAMPDFSKQPPNMLPEQPDSSIIWVEYMLPTGQVYYYNIVTHVTSWTRPDNACIVGQAEFESICSIAKGVIDTAKSACLSVPPHMTDNTSNHQDEVCNKLQPKEAPSDWTQWREYKNPLGRAYYYNICTQESVWDKPQVLLDFEEKLRLAGVSQAQTNVQQNAAADTDDSTDESEEEVVEYSKKQDSKKQPEAVEEKEPEPKTVNKSRPVARIAIPGTVWYLVRTSDGRCFFYDPSKRHSSWERPEELKDRPDVDKLLSHKQEVMTEDKEEKDVQEEPPSKKIKSETEVQEVVNENELAQQTALGKEAVIKVEAEVAQQRSVDSMEVRMKLFKELLAEKNISAHAKWERELHKIAYDKRYLLLTSRERRQVFEEYVKERAENEDNANNQKINEKEELCRQLLEKNNLSVKSKADVKDVVSKNELAQQTALGKEATIKVEAQVVQQRSVDSLEVRMKLFKELLAEKNVSAHARWERELHKIAYDKRYLLLYPQERKKVFEEYVKERAEKEDNENNKKISEKEELFRHLPEERNLNENCQQEHQVFL